MMYCNSLYSVHASYRLIFEVNHCVRFPAHGVARAVPLMHPHHQWQVGAPFEEHGESVASGLSVVGVRQVHQDDSGFGERFPLRIVPPPVAESSLDVLEHLVEACVSFLVDLDSAAPSFFSPIISGESTAGKQVMAECLTHRL